MTVLLDQATLDHAHQFFTERGSHGCEGTAMIASNGETTRLVIPAQTATPVPYCTVEVTREGKLQLAAELTESEIYVARIHSHPGLAFHSPTDNANPALTFNGALSIVVPYFGLGLRHGLDACAVLQRHAGQWIDLPPGARRDAEVTLR